RSTSSPACVKLRSRLARTSSMLEAPRPYENENGISLSHSTACSTRISVVLGSNRVATAFTAASEHSDPSTANSTFIEPPHEMESPSIVQEHCPTQPGEIRSSILWH